MSETIQVYAKHLSKGNKIYLTGNREVIVTEDPVQNGGVVTVQTTSHTLSYSAHDILDIELYVGDGMKTPAVYTDQQIARHMGATPEQVEAVPFVHEDLAYIRLDAFNLWPGAVIAEQDNWDVGSLQVVTEVHRNADTEQVVVFYRDLDYAGMAVSPAPGVAPRTSVVLVDYNSTFRVYGNVIAPDELGDNNHGQSRNPDGDLYVTR